MTAVKLCVIYPEHPAGAGDGQAPIPLGALDGPCAGKRRRGRRRARLDRFRTPAAGGEQPELRAKCEVRNLREFLVQARKAADPATWETLRWNAEWFKNKNTRIHGLNRE
jgi:hypothetical protein